MKRLFLETALVFFLSLISGILYAFLKKMELFPEDTEIYILSKKYPEIKFLDTGELLKIYGKEDVIIVDARSRIFYSQGHIKGAVNIPYDEFELYPYEFLNLLEKNKNIVIYCEGGYCELGFRVADGLLKNGFKNISVYIDGYPEWQKRGLPCEKNSFQ